MVFWTLREVCKAGCNKRIQEVNLIQRPIVRRVAALPNFGNPTWPSVIWEESLTEILFKPNWHRHICRGLWIFQAGTAHCGQHHPYTHGPRLHKNTKHEPASSNCRRFGFNLLLWLPSVGTKKSPGYGRLISPSSPSSFWAECVIAAIGWGYFITAMLPPSKYPQRHSKDQCIQLVNMASCPS